MSLLSMGTVIKCKNIINPGQQTTSLSCYSGIQEEEMILSLEQTADVKPVKEELLQEEEEKKFIESSSPDISEPLLKEEEKNPELDVMEMLIEVTESQPVGSLYEKPKKKPEALALLAPAAGDTIISLDFSCPGLSSVWLSLCLLMCVLLTPVLWFLMDSEMQLLKEVPLYNDVMLPSTSEKLVLPLSPLPPSEPLHDASTTSDDTKGKRCILDSSATPASSSVVKLITVNLPF